VAVVSFHDLKEMLGAGLTSAMDDPMLDDEVQSGFRSQSKARAAGFLPAGILTRRSATTVASASTSEVSSTMPAGMLD
jgi:hypothetical protein